MATSPTPVFLQTPKLGKVQILPADASALKTIYTGGTNGSKILALIVTSNDTTARDVTWGTTTGGTFVPLGTVNIPINAGQVNNVSAVNLLDLTKTPGLPIDNDGQTYLYVGNGDLLQIKALSTVTAAKEIDITSIVADF